MSRINWQRPQQISRLNRDYWTNPKQGFDQAWHDQRAKLMANLGEHKDHNWQIVKTESGPHSGKLICNTCGGKFISWVPKGLSSNT